jgi:asparagine synthase (glutamine-hydrolysing)
MCGICGIYGLEDKVAVQKMLSVLKHRGPDDHGIYTDENISLGHARLSIIDLSEKAKQPMHNEDESIWLTVNGEIYNFKEIRNELSKKGHYFYSNSDSEVIIHLYEELGINFLDKLRGMFALALYDKVKKRLILARDPIGKKPLYYYKDHNFLIFSSEIKAIFEYGIKKEIDQTGLWSYLAYQYALGDRTLFKGIKKVLPGNFLVFENADLVINKYWDISEQFIDGSEEFFIKKLRELLEESVRLRMNADVPVGAFLSGGIDSSSVVALAKQYSTGEFHTFSVGFETFSELYYASLVSRFLDTVHHELIITDSMVLKDLVKIAWHYDEPLGDAAIINNYYLAQAAKKEVTVVLAGEGGDELFAGYPNHSLNAKIAKYFQKPVIRPFIKHVIKYIPDSGAFLGSNKFFSILRYFKNFDCSLLEEFQLNSTRIMSNGQIKDLTDLPQKNINQCANFPINVKSNLSRILATDCKNLLPEKFLMKADKATMANSIEERLPLLDKTIIEFAFSIPSDLKIKNHQEKYILRQAVKDILPKEIINRKKMGFGTPIRHWLQNELGEVVHQKISEGMLINSIVRKDRKEKFIRELNIGISKNPIRIWTIFALELWYDIYFKN